MPHKEHQDITSLNIFHPRFKFWLKAGIDFLSEMVSECPSNPQDYLSYRTGPALPTITFGWGWDAQSWGLLTRLGQHIPPSPSQVLRGLCIPHQCLTEQYLPWRGSQCLTNNIASLQMARFRLTGRQLLKRSYVGVAGSELIIIGSSVFIFASICMIHALLFCCWKKVFNKWRLSLLLDSSPASRIFPF